mgnify:CR=1 FL=1
MFGWKDLQINLLNNKQLYSLAGRMWLKLEMQGHTNSFWRTQTTGDALLKLFWSDANDQPDATNKTHLTLAFRIMVHLAQQT